MDPVIQTGTRPSRFGIDTVIGCELGHAWEKMPVLSGCPWGSVSSDECWWGTEFLFMVLIFSFSDYRILRCGIGWFRTHCAALADFKLMAVLPHLPECWDYRYMSPCPAYNYY